MKKSSSPNDIQHQEGQEQSKKLYRSIGESARRLDDAHGCANNVCDLFTPSLQIQRSRFQEYCERLIFFEPALYGRKAEELLWRKTYYDVISTTKKLRKKEYTPEELCNIQTHINAGIGHYHHFISRLQYHFSLDLRNDVDFFNLSNNSKRLNPALGQKPEHIDWAKKSVHRCLVYLGDLNRYKLEIYPNWDSGLATRYYLRALHFKPEYGIPHNQMGTLASSQNRTLDAVFHYMCCLACCHSFEGTENNLLRLFEKNSRSLDELPVDNPNDSVVQIEAADHIKRLILRFLFLVETWFFNKNVADIYILCHQTSMDLQECLSYSKPGLNDSEDIQTDVDSVETDSLSSPAFVTDDMIFKMTVICLLCIRKLQKDQSHNLSMVIAFTLAIYSQLMQIFIDHMHETLLNITLPNSNSGLMHNQVNGSLKNDRKAKKVKKINKMPRRRTKKSSSDDDSEFSDVEVVEEIESSSNSGSDGELALSSSDNESGDEINPKIKPLNGIEANQNHSLNPGLEKSDSNSVSSMKSFTELTDKLRKIDPDKMLDILVDEKLLYSIKLLSSWLITDTEIVRSCGRSTRSLLKQIVQMLNFINIDLKRIKLDCVKRNFGQLKEDSAKIVLSEDVALKGIEIIPNAHDNSDWDTLSKKILSVKDEMVVRILKLLSFGHCLTKTPETGISYDMDKELFVINANLEDVNNMELLDGELGTADTQIISATTKESLNNESKGQLTKMKHMGQLWLAAEVRALETRVRGKTSLSPYLVLDADSLTLYSSMVKHLVNSKKFIVIIPSAVVSALDDLKREKSEARDAIRWLEFQLHHGNRFCRAQRPQERTSLPLIKYPKKKDKEMFTFIQLVECCHYLTLQQKDTTNLVTLLLGNENILSNCENREMSYTGLARSAGINLEIITVFYEKWRKNYKSKKEAAKFA